MSVAYMARFDRFEIPGKGIDIKALQPIPCGQGIIEGKPIMVVALGNDRTFDMLKMTNRVPFQDGYVPDMRSNAVTMILAAGLTISHTRLKIQRFGDDQLERSRREWHVIRH